MTYVDARPPAYVRPVRAGVLQRAARVQLLLVWKPASARRSLRTSDLSSANVYKVTRSHCSRGVRVNRSVVRWPRQLAECSPGSLASMASESPTSSRCGAAHIETPTQT